MEGLRAIVALALSVVSGACAASIRHPERHAAELRAAVAEGAADQLAPSDVVIPFAFGPDEERLARRLTGGVTTLRERVLLLAHAIDDPARLGIKYEPNATRTLRETLDTRRGNCFSIASLFVGLARAAGLRAHFVMAEDPVYVTRPEDGFVVASNHISAAIPGRKGGALYLDYDRTLFNHHRIRRVSDREAVALYYNNLAYERLREAAQAGQPPPLDEARALLRVAIAAWPELASAHNNLGVIAARQRRWSDAARHYADALALDPDLPSPKANLARLGPGPAREDLAHAGDHRVERELTKRQRLLNELKGDPASAESQ